MTAAQIRFFALLRREISRLLVLRELELLAPLPELCRYPGRSGCAAPSPCDPDRA